MEEERALCRVGVFDSGIGGLTVLRALHARLPQTQFCYLGDNGNAPYGSRPAEEIALLTERGLCVFERLGVDAAVIACNTATAVCLERMRARFSFPILGVEPAVKRAAEECRDVLVLATPRTAESLRLSRLIARFPQTRFTVAPMPHLAGDIERSITQDERFDPTPQLPSFSGDGVVLGCTHYSFFRREIAAFYGATVFDGSEGTANRLADTIMVGTENHQIFLQNPNKYLTSSDKQTAKSGCIFLGKWGKTNKAVYERKRLF